MGEQSFLQPNTNQIQVPIVLIDYAGQSFEVQAPLNTPQILLGMGPIGKFVFVKTDEVNELGRPVYRQAAQPISAPALPSAGTDQ